MLIKYVDDDIVLIDKPSGLLVHPSDYATDRETCLSAIRDELGKYVYPVHRLDRGTSGVLVMALNTESARSLHSDFAERRIEKEYVAVVRGWLKGEGQFSKGLTMRGTGDRLEAETNWIGLSTGELPYPTGPHSSSRYSLVLARPKTGRRHQIRRHFSNNDHPIVGDAVHGDGQHNRLFRRLFGTYRLLLHASGIKFEHPRSKKRILFKAPIRSDMGAVCVRLGWENKMNLFESKLEIG